MEECVVVAVRRRHALLGLLDVAGTSLVERLSDNLEPAAASDVMTFGVVVEAPAVTEL